MAERLRASNADPQPLAHDTVLHGITFHAVTLCRSDALRNRRAGELQDSVSKPTTEPSSPQRVGYQSLDYVEVDVSCPQSHLFMVNVNIRSLC